MRFGRTWNVVRSLVPVCLCYGIIAPPEIGAAGPLSRVRMRTDTQLTIRVGPNIRVSTHPRREHDEVQITADPYNPNNLAACSSVEAFPGGGVRMGVNPHTILYISRDGGRTWVSGVEDSSLATAVGGRPDLHARSWDPSCEYGRDGKLYFATANKVEEGDSAGRVRLYRSADGGQTWLEPTTIASDFWDKPWIVADTGSTSPFQGRLYLAYYSLKMGGVALVSSSDGGTSFSVSPVSDSQVHGPTGGTVLSDGTLVLVGENSLVAIVSTDGGQTVAAYPIAAMIPRDKLADRFWPRIAADTSPGPFHDRVYAVWEGIDGGRREVQVAYSADKGRSWSSPLTVSDNPISGDQRHRPAQAQTTETPTSLSGLPSLLPAIAVNRNGVVGVSWYDRRDNPDKLGYYVRFSASLDGGETWLPSVRVSERPSEALNPLHSRSGVSLITYLDRRDTARSTLDLSITRFAWIEGGDYAGLAASADGVFHPLWIDNRTGIKQVWTASVHVSGRARQDPTLEGLREITNDVTVTFDGLKFRRMSLTSGVIVGNVYLTNRALVALKEPVRLQMLRLMLANTGARAELDDWHHNHQSVRVWDLSHGLGGGILTTGETSASIPIRFRLTKLRINARLTDFLDEVLRLDLRMRIFSSP